MVGWFADTTKKNGILHITLQILRKGGELFNEEMGYSNKNGTNESRSQPDIASKKIIPTFLEICERINF